MTHSSSLRYPESSRFIQLHEWQVRFCQNNHCAAFLLSFFSSWHDWKIKHDEYYCRYNDIAESHGDSRPHNQNAYLFFTMDDFINALMGLFGKKSISDALELLVSLNVITIHKNPNPRYCFDKTKYFKFYPSVCNQWIKNNSQPSKSENSSVQVIDNYDNAKIDNRFSKNVLPSSENSQPSRKNGQAITDTTNNTTNKNQSINARNDFFENPTNKIQTGTRRESTQAIVDALIEKGMPVNKFYPDVLDVLDELHLAGATVEVFLQGYDMAARITQEKGFGLNYLIKVVNDLLPKQKISHSKHMPADEPIYENDFKNAKSWAGDLL